jgi:trigger factor
VKHEIEHHGRSFEDEGTTEDEAGEQYRKIAERRVRLGLVVAEIGNANKIEVTDEEHQQALIAEVRRFPGQEQQVYDYYRKNPQALASLRAPVFENKVVDFVTELAQSTEKKMTREELAKIIAADEDEVPEEHHH